MDRLTERGEARILPSPVRTATEWIDQDAYEAFLVDRLVHGKY